jgi:hypothetical protein
LGWIPRSRDLVLRFCGSPTRTPQGSHFLMPQAQSINASPHQNARTPPPSHASPSHRLSAMAQPNKIYSACYSNVPVYEFKVSPGVHIMRRRAGKNDGGTMRQTNPSGPTVVAISPIVKLTRCVPDDYINATHILKAAAYDKPARTRILEREVQKGLHEKVQGGYGKYQGAQPTSAANSARH